LTIINVFKNDVIAGDMK